MSDRLSLSIFTIEVDGKPTLAFEAKRCSGAEAICAKLSLLKSGDVPTCADKALLDVRFARPDEAALCRQAAHASQSTDNLMLVYLVEVDGQEDLHHQIRAAGLNPLYRFPSDALRHRDRQQANEKPLGKRRLNAKDD
jgi:response regulator RpfG family c-di-GMP phosphodiesterase